MPNYQVRKAKPPFMDLAHPQIIQYELWCGYWRTEVHARPDWEALNLAEKCRYLTRADEILTQLAESGRTYHQFSEKSLVVTGDGVKLDGLIHPCPFKPWPRSDQAYFLDAANRVLEDVAQFKSIEECRRFLMKKHGSKPRKTILKYAAVAAILLVVLTGAARFDVLQNGYDILRKDGPKAAYQYFVHGNSDLFGQAWAAFRVAKYEEAEALAYRVIEQGERKSLPKGHYLLGHIKLSTGDFQVGLEHLQTAKALYDQIGNGAGSFQSTLGLAKGALGLKDFENAAYYLNLAEQLKGDSNLGHFYDLKSWLSLYRNQYEEGLRFSILGSEEYANDTARRGHTLSSAGFFSALLGRVGDAEEYTFLAEKAAFDQGDDYGYHFNLLNKILINKCRQVDSTEITFAIREWAEKTGDKKVLDYLSFVKKFNCPQWTVSGGSPDPPPDPPETQEGRTQGGKN